MPNVFDGLLAEIARTSVMRPVGRVAEVGRGTLLVSGLASDAAVGDRVQLSVQNGRILGGEVLGLARGGVTVLPDGSFEGLSIGDPVELMGTGDIAPDKSWIGRVIDPFGKALDGRPLLRGSEPRSLRAAPPSATSRRRLGARLETGVAVFNTLLPLVQGQRIGLFAGSGVGKSTLLSKFARGVAADLVVIALIGERGREVREFVEKVLEIGRAHV